MDTEALTALEGSIKKWEAIVAGTGADHGMENCPLCQEFADNRDPDPEGALECYGCPVSTETRSTSCDNTPYVVWARASAKGEGNVYKNQPWLATTPELVTLAQAELDFLKSLLPVSAS